MVRKVSLNIVEPSDKAAKSAAVPAEIDASLPFHEKLRRQLVTDFNDAGSETRQLRSMAMCGDATRGQVLMATQTRATLGAALATLESARATRELLDYLKQGNGGGVPVSAPAPGKAG